MADRYSNFAALRQKEKPNRDFRVRMHRVKSDTVIMAPHGGGIEPGTSEIAGAIADGDHSFYAFEGRKYHGNGLLHITSSRFDEPKCLALVGGARKVVAIHGEVGDEKIVCLGGRDEILLNRLYDELSRVGFQVKRYARFKGLDPKNICNRNKSGAGVQIELSHGCRRSFFRSLSPKGRQEPTTRFYDFVNAARAALSIEAWNAAVKEGVTAFIDSLLDLQRLTLDKKSVRVPLSTTAFRVFRFLARSVDWSAQFAEMRAVSSLKRLIAA